MKMVPDRRPRLARIIRVSHLLNEFGLFLIQTNRLADGDSASIDMAEVHFTTDVECDPFV